LKLTVAAPVLTGPVFDESSGNIFVGGRNNGILYCVRDTASTVNCGCATPPCVGSNTVTSGSSTTLYDPPVVDSSGGQVYATIKNSTNSVVVQAPTTLSSSVAATFGTEAYSQSHEGDFDNNFYTTGTGYLYVCGNGGTNPTLYRIAVTSGTAWSGSHDSNSLVVDVAGDKTDCSPLSEFYNVNTSTDWLFLALPDYGSTSTSPSCAGKPCVENFNISSGFPGFSAGFVIGTSIVATQTTSGIIIDNYSLSPGTSNIYFADILGGVTAYQISQSGL
jgi:hypothetical protein